METLDYTRILAIANPLMAAFFWAIVVLLGGRRICPRDVRWRVSSEGVAIHIAVFCTVNTFIRTFGVIEAPPYLISLWALVIFMHMGAYFLSIALILRRYPTPDGLDIPKVWQNHDH